MDAEKFIEHINEAEKVLKYTFRLELEDDGADDFGKSLIERSACQAYKMFEPLIADRWSGHPFLTNRMLLKDSLCYEKRKELEEKIKESDEKTKVLVLQENGSALQLEERHNTLWSMDS